MFKNLTNYAIKRKPLEALGFYIVYFIAFVLAGAVVGAILGAVGQSDKAMLGGSIVAIICCVGVNILVLKAKGILGGAKSIGLIFLTFILSVVLGSLGGLIPVAYSTTITPQQ